MFTGKKIKYFSLIIFALFTACGREGNSPSTRNDSQDASSLKEMASSFEEDYNQHNADKLAALWADDGVLLDLNSYETYKGPKEISNYFKQQFADKNEGHLDITVDSLQYKSDLSALESGRFNISYKDKSSQQTAFKADLVKIENDWKFQNLTFVNLQSSHSNYPHLKDLAWLIGDWIDKDDNATINFTNRWDEDKNFITQYFNMIVLDQKQLSGYQVIGWDPAAKKIRSWIFDSDGGFGKSEWIKEGNSWYAPTVFTLPDGRKGSATHVFTIIDDNTYSFSSEGRDIDGRVMPNIGPVKVIRKK